MSTKLISKENSNDSFPFVFRDSEVNKNDSSSSSSGKSKKRGMANVENTLNSMKGDIEYKDLLNIGGISPTALKAKMNSSETSIFQKKDYTSSLKNIEPEHISYQNIPLLLKFIARDGKIVPSRISSVDPSTQKKLKKAIKVARYLALLPYVEY